MSDYRDDTNEIAVAGDSTWVGVTSIAESTVKASDEVFYRLRIVAEDTLTVSDEVVDRPAGSITESAQVADIVTDKLSASVQIAQSARVSDKVFERVTAVTTETATVSDGVIDFLTQVITETAKASEAVIGSRRSFTMVEESAKTTDRAWQAATVIIEDTVTVSDSATGRLRAASLVTETAFASELVQDERVSTIDMLTASARIHDELVGVLHALDIVTETAEVMDKVIQADGQHGQAWTTNPRTWATSRYAPFTFQSVTVINGIPYGTNDDGVYALTGGTEDIAASITTGKIDVGSGSIVHPLAAYIEYELDGTAQMDVTQTQSGTAEKYTYLLPNENADELTNGRFVFGRGLRGRHFSFELRLNGTKGSINDMSLEVAQTKRRV